MYFEKESLQNNIGDDLDRRNRNFEKIEADITMMATNLVTNGDFSNGVVGWYGATGAYTVSNGSVTITSTIEAQGEFGQTIPIVNSHKYYARAEMIGTTSEGLSLSGTPILALKRCSGTGSYEKLSLMGTATGAGTCGFRIHSDRAGDISQSPISMKNATLIDLTATFGAGKEPTLAEMDRLMTHFSNSWFDGKQTLNTIRNLYTDKANKVQEAWITPTLLNGWTSDSGNPIQYREDEFGRVWVRGRCFGTTVGSIVFTFVSGYRPTIFHDPICSKFNTNTASIGFARVSVHSSGNLYIHSSTISSERFDLSGVSFSTN